MYEDRGSVATATEEEKKKEEEEEEKDTAAAAPLDNMREAIKVGMEGLKFYVGEDDSGDATGSIQRYSAYRTLLVQRNSSTTEMKRRKQMIGLHPQMVRMVVLLP